MIYFIQCIPGEGPIKIGWTAYNVYRRLDSLQCGCPFELGVLGTIRATPEEECRLHEKFDRHWIRGEWFLPDQEILDYVEEYATKPKPRTGQSRNPSTSLAMGKEHGLYAVRDLIKDEFIASFKDEGSARSFLEEFDGRRYETVKTAAAALERHAWRRTT